MKNIALLSVVSVALVTGCAHVGKEPGLSYKPVPVKESYSIGAFTPDAVEHNVNHYDQGKALTFLASVDGRFSDGDIIAIDGLKWQKADAEWHPIPNPPIPVLERGESIDKYTRRYAEWIENHPHFMYPPLPYERQEAW